MTRIIALAADHGGFPLKVELAPWLQSQGYEISDLGPICWTPPTTTPTSPKQRLESWSLAGPSEGLICGSGVGARVAANKVPGNRTCLCHDVYSRKSTCWLLRN